MFEKFTENEIRELNTRLLRIELLVQFAFDECCEAEKFLRQKGEFKLGIKKEIKTINNQLVKLNKSLYKNLTSEQQDIFLTLVEHEDKEELVSNALNEILKNGIE